MIILPTDPVAVAIIRGAQLDLPILENPVGSNRSPEIDEMCRQWGVPLGSAWCALWLATKRKAAGAEVPPISGDMHPAKAESWHAWAVKTGRFTKTPKLGFAPIYSLAGNGLADHVGCCVVSVEPFLLALEGNTALAGFTREGEMTAQKIVNTAKLLGYCAIYPLDTDTPPVTKETTVL